MSNLALTDCPCSWQRGQGVRARERARVWGGRGVVEFFLSNSYPHALLSTIPQGRRNVLRHKQG